jgi:anti-sigma B factor antagonist
MNLNVEKKENMEILKVEGEIDVDTSLELKQKLKELTSKEVVVDLSLVNYLDSSALGVLIGMYKNLREEEGDLYLIVNSSYLKKIFNITNLNKVFNIFSSYDELDNFLRKEEESEKTKD